jgi:hypothetical protein
MEHSAAALEGKRQGAKGKKTRRGSEETCAALQRQGRELPERRRVFAKQDTGRLYGLRALCLLKNPASGLAWEEVKRRVRSRRGR